jgi:hypothetical protein
MASTLPCRPSGRGGTRREFNKENVADLARYVP